ncbi:MAG: cysteine desulfurase [Candidatus Gracilibacteria bacterium]|nr:cysteine desulfurase [Candidatus Gracilibacteria bacterium]
MNHIYFDNASTTKVDPRVVEKMMPFLTDLFGNPSGLHIHSRIAAEELDKARLKVAEVLNCDANEVVFTGSGTESDNLAIFGYVYQNLAKNSYLITSKVEHHAVLYPFERLAEEGYGVDFVTPNLEGEILPEMLNFKENTGFASIIYANNEIGTINNIPRIAQKCREKDVIFHTDACQAAGVVDLDVEKMGVDMMTLNGSKIKAPKGVGMLYKRKGIKIKPQILGGSQEFGLRAGTENMAGIVGFAEALYLAQKERLANNERLVKMRDRITDYIIKNVDLVRLNGHINNRLPNNCNFSFLNAEGESITLFLDNEGFSVNTGSACTTESLEPSHVLLGIGLPHEVAHGSLRVSIGTEASDADIDHFLEVLPKIIEKIRKMNPIHLKKEDFEGFFD